MIPETVGQYTGLKDKHGKMIFEGDILRHEDETHFYWGVGEGKVQPVIYSNENARFEIEKSVMSCHKDLKHVVGKLRFIVTGTIHDQSWTNS